MILSRCLSVLLLVASLGAAEDLSAWLDRFDPAIVTAEPELARAFALPVLNMVEGSPAQRAGMQVGDRILAMDGFRVLDKEDFALARWAGADLYAPPTVTVLRGDQVIELRPKPTTPRTAGMFFQSDRAMERQLFDQLPLPADLRDADGLTAWAQLPGRHRWALAIWLRHAAPDADRSWISALFGKWRALCRQDVAGAAAMPPLKVPVLVTFAAFLDRLAARHATGEQDPDPEACGVDLLTFVMQHPWPLLRGPAIGDLGDPDFTAQVDARRWLPPFDETDHEQHHQASSDLDALIKKIPAATLPANPEASSYASQCAMAMLDPELNGGWPYRSSLVADPAGRQRILKALNDSIATSGDQPPIWSLTAATLLTYIEVAKKRGDPKRYATALTDALPRLKMIKERSPWLAWRILRSLEVIGRSHDWVNARAALRSLYEQLDLHASEAPSRLLDHLDERVTDVAFRTVPEGTAFFDSPRVYALRALARTMTRVQVEQALAVVDDQTSTSDLAHLLDAWVDLHRGLLNFSDINAINAALKGRGLGLLVDRVPLIMQWQAFSHAEFQVTDRLRECLWSGDDFELPAIRAGLQAIDAGPKDASRAALEELRRRHGSLVGTLVLADACDQRGQKDLAEAYRGKVKGAYDAIFTSMRWAHWRGADQTTSHWQACMVFASSPATAAWALPEGEIHLKTRDKRREWTCAHLSMAQAALALKDTPMAIEQLVQSFTGVKSEGDEPFIVDGEILRGEPRMRTWILKRLKAEGALDAAITARIATAAAADPGLLEAEGQALVPASGPAASPADF